MRTSSRRRFLIGVGALTGAGLFAGCAGVAGGGGRTQSSGTVRFAFWGNNIRQKNYQKAFESLQEKDSDITINVEFADYDAYQERMTTQMAAGNVADIFWVPSPQVMTYYANNLYRGLDDLDTLDLSDYSDSDLKDFELDGQLNTMPFGIFVPVVRYNRTFADEDEVELPADGPGWTWDSLADFAKDYTANNRHDRKALAHGASHDLPFEAWLRQHGEELWTEDGRIGFSEDGLASWIEWWEDLRKAGATTSISEQDGVEPSWEDVGDRVLMYFGNSNHIVDDAAMYPDYDFALRHVPVAADAPTGHQFLYFPRMAVYQDTSDEVAELAGRVLSYCTGDVAMLRTVGLTMGAPVNPRVNREYAEFANPDEKQMLQVVSDDRSADRTPRYEAPPGSSNWRTVMSRILEQITLEDVTISKGSRAMIAEVGRSIERAR